MGAFTRRIMGIETEYGITCTTDGGGARLGAEDIARYLFRPVVERHNSSNVFVPNASRLYLDVGSHPEIATAECDSLSQLIAYDRAGDRIVDELARAAEDSLTDEGIGGQVYLLKNNVDSAGNSYGCHENYLIGRQVVLKTLGLQLLPFLITRQLICGAGSIHQGRYRLSQRADHVWEGVSSATTRSRPIINTRDEPHADSTLYRRLHVIVGDSTLAEPTTALKVGSALLVLEMIEAGFDLPTFDIGGDIAAIRDIAGDLSGGAVVNLVDGGRATALEIQRAYAEAAGRWLEHRAETPPGTPTQEMARVHHLWVRVLDAIEAGDVSALARDVDWAAKLELLRAYQQRLGLAPEDFHHPKLAHIDLAYHDIRPGRGIFPVLEAKGRINRWISDDAIDAAVSAPPPTTRAILRGKFLSAAQELGAGHTADWLRLKATRPEPHIVELADPFATEDPRVDELIAYLREHA